MVRQILDLLLGPRTTYFIAIFLAAGTAANAFSQAAAADLERSVPAALAPANAAEPSVSNLEELAAAAIAPAKAPIKPLLGELPLAVWAQPAGAETAAAVQPPPADSAVADSAADMATPEASAAALAGTEAASAGLQPAAEAGSLAQAAETASGSRVGQAELSLQAAALLQGSDLSARLRASGLYTFSPSVFAGAVVDLTAGTGFSDSAAVGLDLNELYVTASPANVPELRFTVGLMDLTSYFDRNSFAKDSLTHFFNPVFQTNPALSAVNIGSRPGVLVNWTPLDQLSLTATAFSSSRSLNSFALDAFAGEVGVRFGNAIVRGTYVSGRDAGFGSSFAEAFSLTSSSGTGLGPQAGDRETAFGLNGEYFIPGINLGLFGRYGWYTNQDQGESGTTYSFGVNALDVFLADDRLGLAYGRQLSNASAQAASGRPTPDVLELFYDLRLSPNLRAGVSVQQRNAFSETYLGLRVRYDLSPAEVRRILE